MEKFKYKIELLELYQKQESERLYTKNVILRSIRKFFNKRSHFPLVKGINEKDFKTYNANSVIALAKKADFSIENNILFFTPTFISEKHYDDFLKGFTYKLYVVKLLSDGELENNRVISMKLLHAILIPNLDMQL